MSCVTRLVLAIALVAVLVLLAIAPAAYAQPAFRVAPGPLVERCQPTGKAPEVRLGPNGVVYDYIEPPVCRWIRLPGAPTYHLVDGVMVPDSPDGAAIGAPCIVLMRRDHMTFGQTAAGRLWSLCTDR